MWVDNFYYELFFGMQEYDEVKLFSSRYSLKHHFVKLSLGFTVR